jgi:hypothetical protein
VNKFTAKAAHLKSWASRGVVGRFRVIGISRAIKNKKEIATFM